MTLNAGVGTLTAKGGENITTLFQQITKGAVSL